jgi:hypothetical protein
MNRFAPLIRHRGLLIAAGAFILFGIWAVYLSPWSARAMEARLGAAATSALERVGEQGWASVEMRGQRAVITGFAPSEDARARAVRAVRQADWAGGALAGGITRVVDETRLALPDAGLAIRADLQAGDLVVRGFAPDPGAATRVALIARALVQEADVFLEESSGQMPDGWEAAVRLLLGELVRLEEGTAFLLDEGIALAGYAGSAQTAESAAGGMMSPPPPFGSAAHIRAGSAVFAPPLRSVALCDLLVQAALGPHGSALESRLPLTDLATDALAEAGSAFSRCQRGELVITTPARSGTAVAEALMAPLMAGGAAPERIMVHARGPAGETGVVLEVIMRGDTDDTPEAS